jgi:hypothetical protein
MTQLICLVQRLSLGDSSRSIVREGETFEVDAEMAAIYIKGGIAALQETPESGRTPDLKLKLEIQNPRTDPESESEAPADEPVQTEEAEKVTQKGGKKKGR